MVSGSALVLLPACISPQSPEGPTAMTTAAQKLAEYGLTMDLAHAWLMSNMSNLPFVLETSQAYGITNTMLGEIAGWPGGAFAAADVKAYFSAHGINSAILDPNTGAPAVTSISPQGGMEDDSNSGVVHTVTLASAPLVDTEYTYSITFGTASTADLGSLHFIGGAIGWDDTTVIVPAGVSEFTMNLDIVDDALVEGMETYTITVGDLSINSSIADNDTGGGGGGGSSILSNMLDGFTPVLDVNDRTGALATATIRAQVLNSTTSANYWALFDPAKFEGSADGVFTPAELGVSHLGTLPATAETIESLFYGTFIDVALSIDFEEAGPIGQFFFANLSAIVARNPTVIDQYVDLLVTAAADPAVLQAHPEAALPAQMVVGLINYASHVGLGGTNNIFDALLTI